MLTIHPAPVLTDALVDFPLSNCSDENSGPLGTWTSILSYAQQLDKTYRLYANGHMQFKFSVFLNQLNGNIILFFFLHLYSLSVCALRKTDCSNYELFSCLCQHGTLMLHWFKGALA